METLLKQAILAVREAGAEIMLHYASTDFETKTDGSPVTIADTRSNEILIAHLTETGIPILSEESGYTPFPYKDGTPFAETAQGLATVSQTVSPSRTWIIDPLDGTKDFIKKNGDFSVMIGLLEDGRPVLGVVYAPAHKTLYYAIKGSGAFVEKDGIVEKLTVSNRSIENLRCIRSVNNFTPRMELVAKKLSATLHPHGSIGIKAGLLGEDDGEFFFSWGKLGEWDVCAPEIITQEAGGTVTDCLGNVLSYGAEDHRLEHGIVFSNTSCHERVLEAIRTTPPVVE